MSENSDPLIAFEDEPEIEGGVHQPYHAYNQGYDAARQGLSRSLNPYVTDYDEQFSKHFVREAQWWNDGHDDCTHGVFDER